MSRSLHVGTISSKCSIEQLGNHTDIHSSIGYVVSAIFICAEYQRLGIHFREYRVLRISFWIKLAFIFLELGLVIGFGVSSKYKAYNVSAILEWIVSLVYIFYVWYVEKPVSCMVDLGHANIASLPQELRPRLPSRYSYETPGKQIPKCTQTRRS